MRLKDKVALITGAGRGIGSAIAERFAKEGAKLVLCDLDADNIQSLVKTIKAEGGQALGFKVDVTDPQAIGAMVEKSLAQFETIDILVNNAGITRDGMFHKMSEEDWDLVMDVNLKGVFHVTHAVVPIMRAKNTGKIVNISSASRFGNAGQTNYSASKEAVVGFTRSLAFELGPKGVNVNAVAPGTIETDMYWTIPEHLREFMKLMTPLGRAGAPEDIANLCLFLASEEANYITGQVIQCDGGMFRP